MFCYELTFFDYSVIFISVIFLNEISIKKEKIFMDNYLFETKTILTYDVYRKFSFEAARKTKFAVVLIVYEVIVLLLAIASIIMKRYTIFIESVILLIIFPLLTYLIRIRAINKIYYSNKVALNQEYIIRFYPDCIVRITDNSTANFKYDQLYKVIESKENFYIMISANQGIPIIKSNCSPELIEFIRKLKR